MSCRMKPAGLITYKTMFRVLSWCWNASASQVKNLGLYPFGDNAASSHTAWKSHAFECNCRCCSQRLLVGTLLCDVQWDNRKFTLEFKQSLRKIEIIGTQFWDFLSFSHELWTMTNTLRAKNIPLPLRDVYNSVFQISKFHDLTNFMASIHLPENKFKEEKKAMLWERTLRHSL